MRKGSAELQGRLEAKLLLILVRSRQRSRIEEVKETVVSSSENVRVVRLGGVRVDWRVERLVRSY